MLPEEKVLLRVSLGISLLGLGIIVFLSIGDQTREISSEESEAGDEVAIKGEVKSVQQRKGVVIMKVQDESKTYEVVAFQKKKPVNVEKGDDVEVRGVVEEYKGRVQVVADEIKVV